MKILGIVGSARKRGNTDTLIDKVLEGAEKQGAEIKKIYLADYDFKGCISCEGCQKEYKCIIKDDMQKIYKLLDEADGLVLGSPTYFYNVNGLTKNFLDRLYSYEIFDDEDRSVWLSPNEVNGMKYAVTVAVSEQKSKEDMGFTSEALSKTLVAVGWRSVANIKALHVFEKGKVTKEKETIKEAYDAGERLVKTLVLAEKVKKN
ncbi:MAG: flavodoxin family protein [Peptostreptococcaceae bacterium]|nr:flavodoxin family protein [Peptostreptococcaceae bacterium]